jgi:hypothetical protein
VPRLVNYRILLSDFLAISKSVSEFRWISDNTAAAAECRVSALRHCRMVRGTLTQSSGPFLSRNQIGVQRGSFARGGQSSVTTRWAI